MTDSITTSMTSANAERVHQAEAASPLSTSAEETRQSSTKICNNEASPKKRSLKAVMVFCIDSALEELGPLSVEDLARVEARPLSLPTTRYPQTTTNDSPKPRFSDNDAKPMPTAESLYGACSPSSSPSLKYAANLHLRAGISRRPRYQRRNSVTKFSLSCALNEVQRDDQKKQSLLFPKKPQLAGSMTNRHLWHQLYNRHSNPTLPEEEPSAQLEVPNAPKRRRESMF